MHLADPMSEVKGPFFAVAENAPRFAILTSMIYLIATVINYITHGAIGSYMSMIFDLMMFGALFALPFAIIDITYRGLSKYKTDVVMMGFTNYFALLIAYAEKSWGQLEPIIKWIEYIYLGLFVVALTFLVVSYLVYMRSKSASG